MSPLEVDHDWLIDEEHYILFLYSPLCSHAMASKSTIPEFIKQQNKMVTRKLLLFETNAKFCKTVLKNSTFKVCHVIWIFFFFFVLIWYGVYSHQCFGWWAATQIPGTASVTHFGNKTELPVNWSACASMSHVNLIDALLAQDTSKHKSNATRGTCWSWFKDGRCRMLSGLWSPLRQMIFGCINNIDLTWQAWMIRYWPGLLWKTGWKVGHHQLYALRNEQCHFPVIYRVNIDAPQRSLNYFTDQ